MPGTARAHTVESLRAWLTEHIADYVNLPVEAIDPTVPLVDYGLDSVSALNVSANIEDHLGITVDATVMWDNETIEALGTALMAELEKASAED
ncbi:acyl carrier protein [Streptomyces parvus]|uniref:acyl carrier protein n=1 Tax=Streptomyces parvus TaxID=66428 RepID=UPI0035DFDCC9